MNGWTYYCVECGKGTNKLLPSCSACHGRVAERNVWLRYMRRFKPDWNEREFSPEFYEEVKRGLDEFKKHDPLRKRENDK